MSDPLTDRLPPQNRDAERGVLGAILRDPETLSDVQTVLRADNFYFDAHQKIYQALCDLQAESQPIDLVLLHDKLRKNKQLDDVGGVMYLTELWEAVPTGANAEYHAKLVRDAAMVRGLIHTANELLRDAYAPTMPAEELLAQAERKLFAQSADAGTARDPKAVGLVAREALATLDARIAAGDALCGLSTGFADLDHVLGGLRAGELVVIGARPSLGKTAIALNIAERVAESGNPALLFSLEMPGTDIASRLISMESSVPMHRMSHPTGLRQADIDKIFEAATGPVAALRLLIDDAPDASAARVAAVARRACRRNAVKLIVIDYLQLMRPENPKDNRTQQVGTLALRVKQMARQLCVPVILLSQLNRETDHAKRRPVLADLRESGDIEAHADRVLLLHRDPGLSDEDAVWPIEVLVAKNRNGPIGDVRLAYRRPVLRFENAAA